jgi:predicted metal-dependent phosphoesterase TrpH
METSEDEISIEQFCSLVKRANGVPVLAHPGNDSPDKLCSFLRDMQANGIEGIECFYPSHSKESTEIYVDYCRKNNLRITGGSDCHGEYDKSEGFTMGALHIPVDILDLRGIV